MKYLALIYSAEGSGPQYGSAEFGPLMKAYQDATKTFTESGSLIAGEALQPVATATSIQIRNDETILSDGPFSDIKEQLGGFYLFDCDNLDAAIALAKLIPTAQYGTIEVRPVMDYRKL